MNATPQVPDRRTYKELLEDEAYNDPYESNEREYLSQPTSTGLSPEAGESNYSGWQDYGPEADQFDEPDYDLDRAN